MISYFQAISQSCRFCHPSIPRTQSLPTTFVANTLGHATFILFLDHSGTVLIISLPAPGIFVTPSTAQQTACPVIFWVGHTMVLWWVSITHQLFMTWVTSLTSSLFLCPTLSTITAQEGPTLPDISAHYSPAILPSSLGFLPWRLMLTPSLL